MDRNVAVRDGVDFTVFDAEHELEVHFVAGRELEKLRIVSQTTKSATVAVDRVLSGALSPGPRGCRESLWCRRQATACLIFLERHHLENSA